MKNEEHSCIGDLYRASARSWSWDEEQRMRGDDGSEHDPRDGCEV
jgi:hypothetical protein